METKNEVVLFKADDQEFPMEIIDQNGEKWVTSQHLAKALGVKNIRALHNRLIRSGEIKEGKHCCNVKLQQVSKNGVEQERDVVAYSYRGMIRMAMRSDGKRAQFFRDWAEDVLYAVMVTGSYGIGPSAAEIKAIEHKVDRLHDMFEAFIAKADPMGGVKLLEDTKGKAIKREYGSKAQWVLSIIAQHPAGIALEDLYTATGCQSDSQKGVIRATAHKLFRAGRIERPGRGVYAAGASA